MVSRSSSESGRDCCFEFVAVLGNAGSTEVSALTGVNVESSKGNYRVGR